jgi:GMP synthase (glutamine-hydrolysing)
MEMSIALRLLVVEGNTRAGQETYRIGFGRTASEAYAEALRELSPDAHCEFCYPAEGDARLPDGAHLRDYDGVFLTGSALNIYDGGVAVERQIALVRAVFASGTPMFGSCWGLQVASAATGGSVEKNPRGREIGVARGIRLTPAGSAHPLLAGREIVFDALCSHIDHVTSPPPTGKVLAGNAMSEVQAIEIRFEGSLFWGVQYHPEFSLAEISAIIRRQASALASDGLFDTPVAARIYADEISALEHDPRGDVAARLCLGRDILEPSRRRLELGNFLETAILPTRSGRR